MNNTHVLVELKALQAILNMDDVPLAIQATAIMRLVSKSKQLDLSDEAIKEKAEKYSLELLENQTIDRHERTWIESIYKQTLIDLK